MLPTPTLYPTPAGTPLFQLPPDLFSQDMATQAVQTWHMFGDLGTGIQITLLLIIILGGLTMIVRSLKEL